MRRKVLLLASLLGLLGMWGCNDGATSTAESPSAAEAAPAAGAALGAPVAEKPSAEYTAFKEAFVDIELPHIVGPDMDPDLPALPDALQLQFLERSSDLTRPYGKFALADGFDCLVTVEDPTEGVHYLVLTVFTPQGKKTGSLEIAGNDGNEYNGFLRADKKISVTEAPSALNGLKEAKERVYEIDAQGQIVPVQ